MKIVNKICILTFLVFSIELYSQEIKVTDFRTELRDVSARENTVKDGNGDACAIIKARTGLQNLKFSGDLGIQKTEVHDGEYWLWVSPNTRKLSFEAEGIGKVQYQLPEYAQEYGVYVIFLTAVLPDKIIYKDINSVTINTKPVESEIYIDKIFMGKSPMTLNVPSDTISYEIRKKRYSSKTGEFTFSDAQKELFVSLSKNPDANRMFLNVYASGGNKYGTPFFGLETGTIGKTGWYISFVPPIQRIGYIAVTSGGYGDILTLVVDREKFTSKVGDTPDNYYIKLADKNNTFYNHFRLKAGLTQRIFKNTFIRVGAGFATVNQWFKLIVIPYSNDPLLVVPLNKTYFGKREYIITSLALETGITARLSNRYLLSLNISSTGFSSWFSKKLVDQLWPLEASLGFGYNF